MRTRRWVLAAIVPVTTAGCLGGDGSSGAGSPGTASPTTAGGDDESTGTPEAGDTAGFAATLLDGGHLIRLDNRSDRTLSEYFTVHVLSEDEIHANGAPGDPLPPDESMFLYRRGEGPAAQIGGSRERPTETDAFVPFDARPLTLEISDGTFRAEIPVEQS